jgi:hypothetical protein
MPTPTTPTTTDNEPSPPRATADKFVSSTALCERFGLARNAIPRYVAEGMPGLRLDSTRRVFPANECEAWLAERAVDASSDVEKHRSVHAEGLARTRRAPASLQALITIIVVDNAEPYACPRKVARGEVEIRADARRR